MSTTDTTQEPLSGDDITARKAVADSLRRQIESLKDREPKNLNEFIERKMAEDRAIEKGDE
jgi:hypothetical protein